MRFELFVFLLPIFVFLLNCNSAPELSPAVEFFQNRKALWIQDQKELPQSDSLFYLDDPAPLFSKTFNLDHPP